MLLLGERRGEEGDCSKNLHEVGELTAGLKPGCSAPLGTASAEQFPCLTYML